MTLIALFCLFAVAFPSLCAGIFLWRAVTMQSHLRFIFFFVLFGVTLLLLRPHGDTFNALDHSGYRLMANAIVSGRTFHEVDHALLSAPPGIRNALMLLPTMDERNTRDRSFLVKSLETGKTEPFFYPLLPLLSAGVQTLWPWGGLDLAVPLLGVLCFTALLLVGAFYGRGAGILTALALFIGCPLPMMLFRGFYTEAAGSAFLAMAIGVWLLKVRHRYPLDAILIGLALGLSVSFHPVFIVLAIPVLALFLFDPTTRPLSTLAGLASFMAGLLPIILFTEYVCTPYGEIRLSSFVSNFNASASHRLALGFGVISGLTLIAGLATKRWWTPVIEHLSNQRWFWMSLLFTGLIPLIISITSWSNKGQVRLGLADGWSAIQWPLGVLLSIGVLGLFGNCGHRRAKALFLVFLTTLPVFIYLKGAEQMGMWSQRRLLPAYIMLVLALLPWLAQTAGRLWSLSFAIHGRNQNEDFEQKPAKLAKENSFLRLLLISGLLVAGLSNWIRWPTPYWTRAEHGALEWVDHIQTKLDHHLTFFDYQPLSFPFAVNNRTCVLGIGEHSGESMPEVMAWLKTQAQSNDVMIASAYEPVLMEDGMQLVLVSREQIMLDRIQSRRALPAETTQSEITIQLMKTISLAGAPSLLAQDKILDGGPLGLRGPWERRNISVQDSSGKRLPATWSRETSAIIGPIPPPDSDVEISIWATSGQDKPQSLTVTPPWPNGSITLSIPPTYGQITGVLHKPITAPNPHSATGLYKFSSPTPYDPANEGIKGFNSDLGVLIHRISINPSNSM